MNSRLFNLLAMSVFLSISLSASAAECGGGTYPACNCATAYSGSCCNGGDLEPDASIFCK